MKSYIVCISTLDMEQTSEVNTQIEDMKNAGIDEVMDRPLNRTKFADKLEKAFASMKKQ